MMKKPLCSICDKELKHEYETDEKGNEVLQEEQVRYWAHNPSCVQEDILMTAHRACFDRAKAKFSHFDAPTQADWGKPFYPKIKDIELLETQGGRG